MNGVKVDDATTAFNSYRTEGIDGYAAVNALRWNDTLSLAAYNYAKAKSEDANTPSSIYYLSNGQMILDFPPKLGYKSNANFALYYAYPADADVKDVISGGFALSQQNILNGLMSASARQFGMGQHGEKWFLIMSE